MDPKRTKNFYKSIKLVLQKCINCVEDLTRTKLSAIQYTQCYLWNKMPFSKLVSGFNLNKSFSNLKPFSISIKSLGKSIKRNFETSLLKSGSKLIKKMSAVSKISFSWRWEFWRSGLLSRRMFATQ